MRIFEKISLKQFLKDNCGNKKDYDNYNLPKRKTIHSSGYDFSLINDFTIKKNEIIKIPLGVKVKMEENDFLMIVIRSSIGFKYNIRLTNQVGIIDSDYYNNSDNEGHIWISLQNEGNKDISFKKGDNICQGIFLKYGVIDNEEKITHSRQGGIGSTGK